MDAEQGAEDEEDVVNLLPAGATAATPPQPETRFTKYAPIVLAAVALALQVGVAISTESDLRKMWQATTTSAILINIIFACFAISSSLNRHSRNSETINFTLNSYVISNAGNTIVGATMLGYVVSVTATLGGRVGNISTVISYMILINTMIATAGFIAIPYVNKAWLKPPEVTLNFALDRHCLRKTNYLPYIAFVLATIVGFVCLFSPNFSRNNGIAGALLVSVAQFLSAIFFYRAEKTVTANEADLDNDLLIEYAPNTYLNGLDPKQVGIHRGAIAGFIIWQGIQATTAATCFMLGESSLAKNLLALLMVDSFLSAFVGITLVGWSNDHLSRASAAMASRPH